MQIMIKMIKPMDLELKESKTGRKYASGWVGLGRDKRTGASKGIAGLMIWKTDGLTKDTKVLYNVVAELEISTYMNKNRPRITVRDFTLTPNGATATQPMTMLCGAGEPIDTTNGADMVDVNVELPPMELEPMQVGELPPIDSGKETK